MLLDPVQEGPIGSPCCPCSGLAPVLTLDVFLLPPVLWSRIPTGRFRALQHVDDASHHANSPLLPFALCFPVQPLCASNRRSLVMMPHITPTVPLLPLAPPSLVQHPPPPTHSPPCFKLLQPGDDASNHANGPLKEGYIEEEEGDIEEEEEGEDGEEERGGKLGEAVGDLDGPSPSRPMKPAPLL